MVRRLKPSKKMKKRYRGLRPRQSPISPLFLMHDRREGGGEVLSFASCFSPPLPPKAPPVHPDRCIIHTSAAGCTAPLGFESQSAKVFFWFDPPPLPNTHIHVRAACVHVFRLFTALCAKCESGHFPPLLDPRMSRLITLAPNVNSSSSC